MESCCFIKSKIQIRCSQCRGAFWVIAYKRASAYWLSIHDIGRPARLHSSQRDVFKRPVKVSTGRGFFFFFWKLTFVLCWMGLELWRQWCCPPLPTPGLTGNAPGPGWDGRDQPLIHQPLPLRGFTTSFKRVIKMYSWDKALLLDTSGSKHFDPFVQTAPLFGKCGWVLQIFN